MRKFNFAALPLSLALLAIARLTEASYCGQAAVPYSLEILASGQPLLGCARPACFGWTAAGGRSADPAQFYRIDGRPDGFLRETDQKGPVVRNASGFQPQYSICDRSYLSSKCSEGSWVGGIAPSPKIESGDALRLMCCYYNKLADATSTGGVELRAGQIVDGGEVRNADGRVTAFEYIANIQRLFDHGGRTVYVVTMKKFTCVPEPPVSTVVRDSDATNFLIDNILQSTSTTTAVPPRRAADSQAMPFIDGNMDDSQTVAQQQSANNEALTSRKSFGAPIAQAMYDDSDAAVEPSQSLTEQAQQRQQQQQQQQYQKPQRQQQQQQNYGPKAGQFAGNSVIDNNYAPRGYFQQQPQQQQQSYYNNNQQQNQQNSLFNPFGLFGASQQWFAPQQQQSLLNNNFGGQQQQQQSHQQPQQQQQQLFQPAANPFTLIPPLSGGAGGSGGRNIVDSALPRDLPKEPLIEIPAPEDLDSMIPANSRQLIANMARTFLSYFQ